MQTSSERITETSWNRLRSYAAVKQMLLPECPTLNSLPVIHSPFTCPENTRWVNPSLSFSSSFSSCPFYLSWRVSLLFLSPFPSFVSSLCKNPPVHTSSNYTYFTFHVNYSSSQSARQRLAMYDNTVNTWQEIFLRREDMCNARNVRVLREIARNFPFLTSVAKIRWEMQYCHLAQWNHKIWVHWWTINARSIIKYWSILHFLL